MSRSEETEIWVDSVYEAIKEIPRGKVTTYKHIAELVGTPQRARQVGMCLWNLAPTNGDTSSFYNLESVPWQRVINSKATISPRGNGWADRQAERLLAEGVQVFTDSMGEHHIDLVEYGWFPDYLPSEALPEDDE